MSVLPLILAVVYYFSRNRTPVEPEPAAEPEVRYQRLSDPPIKSPMSDVIVNSAYPRGTLVPHVIMWTIKRDDAEVRMFLSHWRHSIAGRSFVGDSNPELAAVFATAQFATETIGNIHSFVPSFEALAVPLSAVLPKPAEENPPTI